MSSRDFSIGKDFFDLVAALLEFEFVAFWEPFEPVAASCFLWSLLAADIMSSGVFWLRWLLWLFWLCPKFKLGYLAPLLEVPPLAPDACPIRLCGIVVILSFLLARISATGSFILTVLGWIFRPPRLSPSKYLVSSAINADGFLAVGLISRVLSREPGPKWSLSLCY